MAKLKSKFNGTNSAKPPVLGGGPTQSNVSKTPVPKSTAMRIVSPSGTGQVPQALNFGTLHTKSSPNGGSSSQWMSLLNNASGGVSGLLGGGLLSASGFGLVSQLVNLFGGKSTPAAPSAFESPVSQQDSLNITSPGAASSISIGVHPTLNASGRSSGIYKQSGSSAGDQHAPNLQVVQIVKQALLTSSSLNDVISEI